ncbi:putative F-box associated interaction domain, F-box-like domain superfamily [Helianthus annuus]|nr:putative F-box associated interaction domain, F-box-like domain superfamily [Helianthus annuus]
MDSKLSSEMIMEIMSRTSLKTLGVMRCASKELNALTYEPYLFDLYKKRNKIISGFLIQNMRRGCINIQQFAPSPDSNSLDLAFLPRNAQVLATSEQGIMVFKIQDPMNCRKYLYHVCKPSTKQVLTLPTPKGNHTDQKFAIVVMGLKPLHYKIIRFSEQRPLKRWRKFYTAYRCDIFDSMKWKWRSLKHVTLDYCVFLTNPQPVTNSGSIYMLLTNNNILKFDAYSENEKWEVFSSPIPYDESRTSVELVKYNGSLGLACKPPDAAGCWEIWVLRKDGLWVKEADAESESKRESLKALYDSETSVMVDCETFLFYRFKQGNNMIKKVVLKDTPYQIFSFRSDVEPVDLK